MKKLISILSLTMISLYSALPSFAKDISIQFPKNSYCGSFHGRVREGDNFVLNLGKEQQLIIRKTTNHDYSVIAPNGRFLEANEFPNQELQYWTGNQSGNFKVRVNSVPYNMQIKIEFCVYSGEGAL